MNLKNKDNLFQKELDDILENIEEAEKEYKESTSRYLEVNKKTGVIKHDLSPQEIFELGNQQKSYAVPILMTILRDEKNIDESRTNAAWALGKIKANKAVPALISVLDDPNPNLREKAIWALGQIGNPRCYASLLKILRNPDESLDVKWTATMTMKLIGRAKEVEPLMNALRKKILSKKSR